ncbi:MAG: O-antigen ligase family protein [Lachnospiraceae bacterium]|nr:O-antigen ligase family protein [Lachnospiraceae bacterium]
MSQYKKKKTTAQNNYEFLHGNYALIPLMAVIFIVPLIVRLYRYDPNLSQFYWFLDSTEEIDVFLYWKSRIFTALGAIMGLVLVFQFTNRKFRNAQKKTIWLYPLAAYGILTLLSTLFSQYRSFGFSGIHEQFESVWVILSYCVLTFFAYVFVKNAADLATLRRAFFALFTVLCALGITQLRGKDFWETKFGRQLMVPEKYAPYRESLSFNFSHSGTHQVYLTFYNPNYVGMFASLVLPFSIFCIFSVRKWWQKLLWIAISVGLLVCTFNSGSKTFLISIAICILAALIFCRKVVLKRILFVVPVCIALFFGARAYFKHIALDPIQYVKNAIRLNKNSSLLDDIRFTQKDVVIEYNNATLHVTYAANELGAVLIFLDGNGQMLDYTSREDGYTELADPTFSGLLFRLQEGNAYYPWLASIHVRGCIVYFTITEDGCQYINNVGKFAQAIKAPASLFGDYDSFASGRGYLWSRSIPMLRHSLILGTGADSFSLVFPHNDLPGRINSGFYYSLVTKPHNLYLQIGVQHGVPALLCFLAVCLIYLFQSLSLYWKSDFSDRNHFIGTGIMLGVLGYLIAGISNDSCVAIAPLFWALLGIGFAVNQINKKSAAEAAFAANRTAGNPSAVAESSPAIAKNSSAVDGNSSTSSSLGSTRKASKKKRKK